MKNWHSRLSKASEAWAHCSPASSQPPADRIRISIGTGIAATEMPTPKQRLPCSTFGRGGGGRRAACGSAVLPPVVVLVFLLVVAPSLFFVVRNDGRAHAHVHVASGPICISSSEPPFYFCVDAKCLILRRLVR